MLWTNNPPSTPPRGGCVPPITLLPITRQAQGNQSGRMQAEIFFTSCHCQPRGFNHIWKATIRGMGKSVLQGAAEEKRFM